MFPPVCSAWNHFARIGSSHPPALKPFNDPHHIKNQVLLLSQAFEIGPVPAKCFLGSSPTLPALRFLYFLKNVGSSCLQAFALTDSLPECSLPCPSCTCFFLLCLHFIPQRDRLPPSFQNKPRLLFSISSGCLHPSWHLACWSFCISLLPCVTSTFLACPQRPENGTVSDLLSFRLFIELTFGLCSSES